MKLSLTDLSFRNFGGDSLRTEVSCLLMHDCPSGDIELRFPSTSVHKLRSSLKNISLRSYNSLEHVYIL